LWDDGIEGDSKGVGDCQKNELQAKENTKKRFGVEVIVGLEGIYKSADDGQRKSKK
jgi:hypothetical protein